MPEIELHLASDFIRLWQEVEAGCCLGTAGPPFWAFAWAGGQAVARYLLDHPNGVSGKRVLDLGSGSGICAIAASLAGAREVIAADVDPLAREAVALNAETAGVTLAISGEDFLRSEPPLGYVITIGDMCYEQDLAQRVLSWLVRARTAGNRVLIADPGRPYFKAAGLKKIATYPVTDTAHLEDEPVKETSVFASV